LFRPWPYIGILHAASISLAAAVVLTFLALAANCSVLLVSSMFLLLGVTQHKMSVRVLPPSEFCSKPVSFDSQNGAL
jgi:hypothetical protein